MINQTDFAICVLYIIAITGLGLWVGLKGRRKADISNDYFLAGKSLRWPMIGLALFATNISCIHLVSLAQSGFDTGLLNGNFEWMAAFTLILLALFFVPFYIRSGVTTLPDFLEKRYNRACRNWLTIISIISAMVVHIGFSLLAGGIVLETLFNINMYLSISIILALTAIYTIAGGLRAVVITESVQTVVLVLGALVITTVSWIKLGGWNPLVETLQSTGNMDKLSMLRPHNDSSGLPWYSIFLGYPVLGIWYWCADQTIVQRVLGAKNEDHARVGALFCGFIKIFPVFIFVMPGLFAYVLAQKGVLDLSSITTITSSGEQIVNSKGIYTLMITQLLPTGLTGIVIAALLSALMSTVSGALNAISTLVSHDLIKRSRPDIPGERLVRLGRIVAGSALLFSILLLPLLNSYESLFIGLNDVIAHIAPPITCVFLLGVFWKKASARAAQLTLWAGSLLGVIVYVSGKLFPLSFSGQTSFMMMSFYLFCVCIMIQVGFSYLYPAFPTRESSSLSWRSPVEALRGSSWPGFGNYKLLAGTLLLTMIILYAFFK